MIRFEGEAARFLTPVRGTKVVFLVADSWIRLKGRPKVVVPILSPLQTIPLGNTKLWNLNLFSNDASNHSKAMFDKTFSATANR
jgi:hypothetical protein